MGFKRVSSLFLLLLIFITCKSSADSDLKHFNTIVEKTVITDQLNLPWQMGFTNDGRIFITERGGLIKTLTDNVLDAEPWFDVSALMESLGEKPPNFGLGRVDAGVQGLALDPDFEHNRFVYIAYAYDEPNDSLDLNKLILVKEDPNTKKGVFQSVLMDSIKGFHLHNSGPLKFGPDGKLYWPVQDRFKPGLSQDLGTLEGSLLRLNKDGSIPSDNPIPGSYIYSYGHRNMQGFDWHPDAGIILATEHGPSSEQGCCHDEVNIVEAGKNYGWPVIRGDEFQSGLESPLIHSDVGSPSHGFTWAPSGATFIEEGPWDNDFLFAGLRSQALYKLELTESFEVDTLSVVFSHDYGRLRSVDQAPDGSIYIITSNQDYVNHPIGKDFLVKLDVYFEEIIEEDTPAE